MKLENLTKRQVRYWCFRFQNANSGGASAKGAPAKLKGHFEQHQFFTLLGGWSGFAKKWDIDTGDPLTVVARDKSIQQEWHETLVENAKVLPKKKKKSRKQVKMDPSRNDHLEIDITLDID